MWFPYYPSDYHVQMQYKPNWWLMSINVWGSKLLTNFIIYSYPKHLYHCCSIMNPLSLTRLYLEDILIQWTNEMTIQWPFFSWSMILQLHCSISHDLGKWWMLTGVCEDPELPGLSELTKESKASTDVLFVWLLNDHETSLFLWDEVADTKLSIDSVGSDLLLDL